MEPVVLLTRPAEDADSFARALSERLGPVPVVMSPLMRMEPLGPLPEVQDITGLIFTSRNGIRAYAALNGVPLPCYCVGPGTAAEASAHGMTPRSADGDATALAALLRAERPAGRWLHLHGRHLRQDLSTALQADGIMIEARAIYDQIAQPLSDGARSLLAGPDPVILPVFSPRSAKLLVQGENPRAPVYIVAMSSAVAREFDPWPQRECTVAGKTDLNSMLAATVGLYRLAARVEGGPAAK